MKNILAVLLLAAAAAAVSVTELLHEEWKSFKIEHQKHYTGREDIYRMKIYANNRLKIAKHNQLYERGLSTFRLKENKYSDMLLEEFTRTMNGYNRTVKENPGAVVKGHGVHGISFMPPANVDLPKTVDWRTKGAVTEVKEQGSCGSCWAFSATGALEGQHFRKKGYLVSLSEQNLIDCTIDYGNHGCQSGRMDYSYKYIKDVGGIDTENSYPYEAMDDYCRYDPRDAGAKDVGFARISSGNEEDLKSAVGTQGPMSVAVDASLDTFRHYSNGVYYDENCSSTQLNHAVLVVGYGTDESGGDYWLVKNSWGRSWGDLGYIKMARNRDNHCGIVTDASYPIV